MRVWNVQRQEGRRRRDRTGGLRGYRRGFEEEEERSKIGTFLEWMKSIGS